MSSFTLGIIGIIAFLVLIMLRMPIAYAMALVGFSGFAYMTNTAAALDMVAKELVGTFSSYS